MEDLSRLAEYTGKAKGVSEAVTFGRCCPTVMVDQNVQESFLKSMRELLGEENTYDLRTAWGGPALQKSLIKQEAFSLRIYRM